MIKVKDNLTKGATLTINGDVIGISGGIIFRKGDKVTVREVVKTGGYWGNVSGYFIGGVILRYDDLP